MSTKKPFTYMTGNHQYDENNKFQQFGWRCTTNETGYKSDTLIGNWNEERYDVKYLSKNRPIGYQVSQIKIMTVYVSMNNCEVGIKNKILENLE